MPNVETELVEWFLTLFTDRTNNPKSVMDIAPEYRVMWTEIREKMIELGYRSDPVDNRFEWDRLYRKHRLSAKCKRV